MYQNETINILKSMFQYDKIHIGSLGNVWNIFCSNQILCQFKFYLAQNLLAFKNHAN